MDRFPSLARFEVALFGSLMFDFPEYAEGVPSHNPGLPRSDYPGLPAP
jgi:hypothetical protein